ncbi:hypothetical protein [Lysinibacillus sphaericus]|uniref:hypothetical protein n=1 Tax=Lysinibacillus sphaericus TaxID=1421 RepID=UPI003CFD27B0
MSKDGFVPKDLLKKLAKEGNEEAKKTLVQLDTIEQKKRRKKIVMMLIHSGFSYLPFQPIF